jgi:hypothetical protein
MSRANAQAVNYDGNGIYTADANTTDFSAPNQPFSFEFTVPQTAPVGTNQNPPGPILVVAPILSGSFTFEGTTIPASSGLYTFSNTLGNETIIDLQTDLQTFAITGLFPTLFIPFHLNADRTEVTFPTGTFPSPPPGFFGHVGSNQAEFAGLVGTAVPVPEPPSFVLVALGASLAAPLLIRRQKLNRLTLAFSRSPKNRCLTHEFLGSRDSSRGAKLREIAVPRVVA